ncbi:metal ABC transporter permease [Portibacter marinus]|uniref:metal ABC transporter permease n=1 Tax=Portibacter marinus TaxID=2898660 RepID=UPI001F35AF9C|nr:iron chelate uptake ABC transporter family permease subunit [Portibacter marinus]
MDLLIDALSSGWAIRAMIASSLVGIMCGVIGCFIVLRNMSLIGDALAHAILPGIFVAFILVGYSTIGFFLGSVVAGLFTAFGITWIQHNVKTKNDAAIGIVFTTMFAIGVMGISYISQGEGVHLDLSDFLFGTTLSISPEDIYITGTVCIFVLASVVVFYRYLFITTFQETIAQTMGISVKMIHYFLMLLLSFAVVSALRSVGVILVVAMLITPASTALLLSNKLKNVLIISAIIGLISANLGLIISIIFNTTPGPAMTVVVTGLYLIAAVFSPKKGLAVRYIRKQRQRLKIEQEDILKQAVKADDGIVLDVSYFTDKLDFSKGQVKTLLQQLSKEGLGQWKNGRFKLTDKGLSAGEVLVRAHRLWETYLVDKVGLNEEQIHDEAEKMEHHMSSEFLDEVDHLLGYPEKDPHGSPIPQKFTRPKLSIIDLHPKSKAKIASKQISDAIESELWELGLLPNQDFILNEIGRDYVEIQCDSEKKEIRTSLARLISVEK